MLNPIKRYLAFAALGLVAVAQPAFARYWHHNQDHHTYYHHHAYRHYAHHHHGYRYHAYYFRHGYRHYAYHHHHHYGYRYYAYRHHPHHHHYAYRHHAHRHYAFLHRWPHHAYRHHAHRHYAFLHRWPHHHVSHSGGPGQRAALEASIARHAAANNIPVSLVHRVIMRESTYNPRAVSNGNYGLMQIRLGTARELGYRGSAEGLLDAETNMTYAVRYLAGAYRVAGGNQDRAIALYARGYGKRATPRRPAFYTPVAWLPFWGTPVRYASHPRRRI